MKQKSSILKLPANIIIIIAYLSGLILKWNNITCYFAWIIPLIIYLIEKNEYVKKQVSQATLLFLINSLCSILSFIILLIFVPKSSINIYDMIITGSLLMIGLCSILSLLISVFVTVYSVIASIKTYNYNDYNIPYLSNYLDYFRIYLDKLKEILNIKKYKYSSTLEEQEEYKHNIKPKRHKIRKKEF